MNELSQLVLTVGLVTILGTLVLVLPLAFILLGQLQPWLLEMARQRAAEAGAGDPAPHAQAEAAHAALVEVVEVVLVAVEDVRADQGRGAAEPRFGEADVDVAPPAAELPYSKVEGPRMISI